jgi:hypothetical protein
VRFAPVPLGTSLAAPRQGPRAPAESPRPAALPDWQAPRPGELHQALERQRARRPRICLPQGETGAAIHWGLVCRAYQPELATAWSACRRTFGAEANQDPVLELSIFWVMAHTLQSFY